MYSGLAPSLQALASWLLSAAQSVPITQLSVVAWALFAASAAFRDGDIVQQR